MRDSERVPLPMREGSGRAARGTARPRRGFIAGCEAVAAEEGRHQLTSLDLAPWRKDAARLDDGLGTASHFVGKADEKALVSCHMIEHGLEEARRAGGRPDRVRPEPGQGKKARQAFRFTSE